MSRGRLKPPYRTLVLRLTVEQYERLRTESYITRKPMAEIIREAVDQTPFSGGQK